MHYSATCCVWPVSYTHLAYPESYEYLKEHYGAMVDEENYAVFYEVFASNIMPDITVIQIGGQP